MKKFLNQKLDNRGSGIVTVLVAIVFLTVLGSMLLMLSFTGFEMKISERKGNQNSYDAEVAMAEIRTGLQEACSDAIADSMYDYLVNSADNLENATNEFRASYMDCIGKWVVKDFDGEKIQQDGYDLKLMSGYDKSRTTCEYNPKALAAMVKNCRRGTITINCHSDKDEDEIIEISDTVKILKSKKFAESTVKFDKDDNNGKITFSNISVTYTNDNRSTTVTTDISIQVPDLAQIASSINNTDIESFALVCSGNINQNSSGGAGSVIIGSSFMNELNTTGEETLSFNDGTVIIKGAINTSDSSGNFGSRLTFGENTNLYANDIIVRQSSIALLGNSFIANDLKLNGNSNATIGGRYYGFGSSLKNADESSSIIANGSNSSVDLSLCSELSLAGFVFISDNDEDTSNDMMTGESISVKPNQMAYLADAKYLYFADDEATTLKHNPIAYNFSEYADENYPEVKLDTETALFKGDFNHDGEEESRTFADYNASLRRVIVNYESQALVYYFVTFKNADGSPDYTNASNFFRDYYKANSSEINSFIKNYMKISDTVGKISVLGTGYTYNGANTTEVPRLWDILANTSSRESLVDMSVTYSAFYENYKKYLSANKPVNALDPESEYCINNDMVDKNVIVKKTTETGEDYYDTVDVIKPEYDNPFYHKIDKVMIDAVSGKKAFQNNGKTVAVVCSGNFTYPADFTSGYSNLSSSVDPAEISLIICKGSITISSGSSFNGLIMCAGDVNINGTVNLVSSEDLFNNAITSTDPNGEKLLKYFRDYVEMDFETTSAGNSAGTSSMVFTLVNYENWKKN